MELRHLEAFVAVAVELHFTRAADRLQIAQSPLSQRIRTLEAELGVQLFERTNRRVALTDAGATFLGEARATLTAAEGARRAAIRARDGETGLLRLGYVASAAFFALPALLRDLHAQVPDVRVALHRLDSAAQVEALAADRIDAGIARQPPVGDARIGVVELAPEALLAALPSSHPLADEESLPLASLAAEPWILSQGSARSSDLERWIRQACARAGFTPHLAHQAPDLPSVIGLVAGGLGVSLLPLGIARLRVPGAIAVPLRADDRPALPSSFIWHSDRTSAVLKRLVAIAAATRDAHAPARAP